MRATWTCLATAVAFGISASSATAQLYVPDPVGPAAKLHDLVGDQSGWAVNGITPEGRRAAAYATGSGTVLELLGQMESGPWWNPSATWALPFEVGGAGDLGFPALDVSRYGSVLLAWQARDEQGNSSGIVGRQFDLNGAPTSNVFGISSTPSANHHWTRVVSNEFGTRHLVAWTTWANLGEEPAVRGQLLDNYLMPVGPELQINHTFASGQVSVDVAMTDEQGSRDAFAAWIAVPEVISGPAVPLSLYLRRVEADGSLSPAVLVAPQVGGTNGEFQDQPALAVLPFGRVMVVWLRTTYRPESPRYRRAIYARRYDANLQPLGDAFPIVDDGFSDVLRLYPKVAADGLGGFAVTWSERETTSAPMAVKLKRFSFDGSESAIAEVSSPVDGSSHLASIASDSDGDLSVVWTASLPNGENHALERRYRGYVGVDIATTAHIDAPKVHQGDSTRLRIGVAEVSSQVYPVVEGYGATTGLTLNIDHDVGSTVSPVGQSWACNGAAPTVCRYEFVLMMGAQAEPLELDVIAPPQSGEFLIAVTSSSHQTDYDLANNTASTTLSVNDLMPEVLNFASVQGVARSASVESDALIITGIDADVTVWISNGEYSLNGSAFTASAGMAKEGDSIRLRHAAAADFDTSHTTRIYVGRQIAEFTSTTESADTSPHAFAFASVGNVARNSVQTSDAVVITGINTPAPISISDGEYSVNGGAFTAVAGTLQAGDSLRLRHTASSAFSTSATTHVTVGDVSASFTSTTIAADVTPDAFSFASVSNVARGSIVTSAAVTIGGIDVPVPVSVSGGAYSINGGPFASAAGTVQAGDNLRLRHTASSAFSTPVMTSVTVGGVAASFTSTTEAADASPDAFAFVDISDARRNRTVESNVVTVSGINVAAAISVSGGGAYSVNGGAYRTSSSTVQAGDRVQLIVIAPKVQYTTVDTTVTIGDRSDVWSVTSGRR